MCLSSKVVVTIFWNARGIIHSGYLQREYYANLENGFNQELNEKRPHLVFHQDNARVHTCTVAMGKLNNLRYELDLAPNDHFLCSNLKKGSAERDLAPMMKQFLKQMLILRTSTQILLFGRAKKLKKHWKRYIEIKENYVENRTFFCCKTCTFFQTSRTY